MTASSDTPAMKQEALTPLSLVERLRKPKVGTLAGTVMGEAVQAIEEAERELRNALEIMFKNEIAPIAAGRIEEWLSKYTGRAG